MHRATGQRLCSLQSAQMFSVPRWAPRKTYSVNLSNYLNGLYCYPIDSFLQRHAKATSEENILWRTKFLVVKDSKVHGVYQPPCAHPLPVSFAPEGIALEDYKNFVAAHDGNVFVLIASRLTIMCGFLRHDGTWAKRPWIHPIDSVSRANRMRTTRNSSAFREMCNFFNAHTAEIEAAATLYFRVSPEHIVLNPTSEHCKRQAMVEHHSAVIWGDQLENNQTIPFGADPRWAPLPSCGWEQLFHTDGVLRFMNNGIVEVA